MAQDQEILLPHGFYHRRVVAIAEPGLIRAAIEDESHHMEVAVSHDGTRVTDIKGFTHRIPWTTCPGAIDKLAPLVGITLRRLNQSMGQDGKQHCTHLYDLTRLAIARAAVGKSVQYDMAIEDRVDGRTRGEIRRDGKVLFFWDVDGSTITGPAPYAGLSLRGTAVWPADLDDDLIEAALVLRRTFIVAGVREPRATNARSPSPKDLDAAYVRTSGRMGVCHTYQPGTFEGAKYLYTWRNLADRREELLKDFSGTRSLDELKTSAG